MSAGQAVDLPPIGLGTAALGGMFRPVPSVQAQALFDAALDRGIRYIDTAPMYGLSTAERRVGQLLDRARDVPLRISTKAGRLMVPRALHGADAPADDFGWHDAGPFFQRYDYGYDGILRSVEDSFQRLGVDHVDVLFVHDIGRDTHGDDNERHLAALRGGGYRALAELKAAGVVGAVGIGVNESQAVLDVLADTDLDHVLLANQFTLLEQDDSTAMFDECRRRGTRLIAAGVFNSGALVGDPHYRYGDLPAEVGRRLDALAAVCAEFDVPLPVAALRFVERFGRFATVLLGARSAGELDQLLAWREVEVPEALWDELGRRGLVAEQWLQRETAEAAR